MTALQTPSLRHLARLTDRIGIVEHARFAVPAAELGYCTDDAGRLLAVACALPSDPDARRLASTALEFLERADEGCGRFRLRCGPDGRWLDDGLSDDACGRAVLGLGAAVAAPWANVRDVARERFVDAARFRSPHPRATAYAVLGAAAVLRVDADDRAARRLVADAADALPAPCDDPDWPWPSERLTYANALVPHAMLVVADVLRDDARRARALDLLDWLVGEESFDGHFSFTPVMGRERDDVKPAFDQQPIEAWAMAEAARAAAMHEPSWIDVVLRAAHWFTGANDAGVDVFDPVTGGGYDGLTQTGVNRNEGAESSLAFVASMVAARDVQRIRRCIRP